MFAYSQKTKSHSCLWNFYALSLTKQKQQATQKKGEGSNSKSPWPNKSNKQLKMGEGSSSQRGAKKKKSGKYHCCPL